MAIIKNAINFGSGFNITAAGPIDSRMRVPKKEDLTKVWFKENGDVEPNAPVYAGMLVVVNEEDTVYLLKTVGYDEKTGAPIAADASDIESWVEVGADNGSVAVEDYSKAVAMATNENLGQVVYVKSDSEYDADGDGEEFSAVTYAAGAYIVVGDGELMKLATSSASGDIVSDVNKLLTDVSKLKGTVGDTESGLVKDVDDLQTTVGDAESGLVKELNDLKQEVSEIEVPVKDVKVTELNADGESSTASVLSDGVATVDLTSYAKVSTVEGIDSRLADAESGITFIKGDYVAKDANARLMTNEEGSKLGGIEAGAQVNKIEVVKVNGTALTVDQTNKSVDVIIPEESVKGVAADEKLIILDDDKNLKSVLNLRYVPANGDEHAVLRLEGKNDAVISSIDATAFIQDGMLKDARLEGPKENENGEKYLVLEFNTTIDESGTTETKDVRINVSDLIDYYNAGNGLDLSGKTFSIKLGDSYLKLDSNGLSVNQALWDKVTEKDNNVLTAATAHADSVAANALTAATAHADSVAADTLTAATAHADSVAANALTAATAHTASELVKVNERVDNVYTKEESDNKFYTQSAFTEFNEALDAKLGELEAGAEVNVIETIEVNGVTADTVDKHASVVLTSNDIKIDSDIKDGDNVAYASGSTISSVLQGIQNSVSAAVSKSLTGVTTSETNVIAIDNTDELNPSISLVVEEATDDTIKNGHIELQKGDNGLFGLMYIGGDDVE